VAVGFKSGVRVLSCATGEARFDLADLNKRSVLAELTEVLERARGRSAVPA
jgi:hypothetical protein